MVAFGLAAACGGGCEIPFDADVWMQPESYTGDGETLRWCMRLDAAAGIKKGMSETEVAALLGRPSEVYGIPNPIGGAPPSPDRYDVAWRYWLKGEKSQPDRPYLGILFPWESGVRHASGVRLFDGEEVIVKLPTPAPVPFAEGVWKGPDGRKGIKYTWRWRMREGAAFKVERGMTPGQVQALLGAPSQREKYEEVGLSDSSAVARGTWWRYALSDYQYLTVDFHERSRVNGVTIPDPPETFDKEWRNVNRPR